MQVTSKQEKPVISIDIGGKDRTFTPEEVSSMILGACNGMTTTLHDTNRRAGKMKETAEAYLGHKVTHAVVTVPA
jgi:heat shock protein 5